MKKSLFTDFFLALFVAVFTVCSAQTANAQASQCGPVFGGQKFTLTFECLNDMVTLIADHSKADNFGWQYTLDSNGDGVFYTQVGGNQFEIYGVAIRETADELWFVLRGNLDLYGFPSDAPTPGVTYSDLFINLTSNDFLTTSNNSQFFGVHFAPNDAGVTQNGLYKNVKVKSVTSINSGFDSLADYENVVNFFGAPNSLGYGDLPANQTYYGQPLNLNVIDTGTFVEPIAYLSDAELTAAGFNPAVFLGGSVTIGFRFNKSVIIDQCGVPGGDGTSCRDCAGIPCGNTQVDACGVCGGDSSTCRDCSGVPNGNQHLDQCGVCGGDGTSCLDCHGVPHGGAKVDGCGVCGGDGTTCLECKDSVVSSTLVALDGSSFRLNQVLGNALKQLSKLDHSSSNSAYVKSTKAKGQSLYNQNWVLDWSILANQQDCTGNTTCVSESNVQTLSGYKKRNAKLVKLIKTTVAKINAAKHNSIAGNKILKEANKALAKANAAVKNVPSTHSVCNGNGGGNA